MAEKINDFEGEDEPGIRYSFTMKYNATADNKATVKAFKEFAAAETDDVYILALKKLLDDRELSYALDSLAMRISMLEAEVARLDEEMVKKASEPPKKVGPVTFGGE